MFNTLGCAHYNFTGHTKETCFHGTPDWYKDLMKARGKLGIKQIANCAEATLDTEKGRDGSLSMEPNNKIQEIIQNEMRKLLKGKNTADGTMVNLAHFNDFADTTIHNFAFNILSLLEHESWIVDMGASSHMCCDMKLIEQPEPTKAITPVHLPDGSIKIVQHTGNVQFSNNVVLTEVLPIPVFHYNLLSVNKLSRTFLAVRKVIGRLYILDSSSLNPELIS